MPPLRLSLSVSGAPALPLVRRQLTSDSPCTQNRVALHPLAQFRRDLALSHVALWNNNSITCVLLWICLSNPIESIIYNHLIKLFDLLSLLSLRLSRAPRLSARFVVALIDALSLTCHCTRT